MKSVFLLTVALGCGLVAVVGVLQYIDGARAAANTAETRVLVAAKEININEPLNETNVEAISWPQGRVPMGVVRDVRQLEGKLAASRLYPGEPILTSKVMGVDDRSGSLKVPLGYRVVSVKVTSDSAVSSLLEPGDRVDVVAVLRQGRENPTAMAKTILKAVRVFAVNREMDRANGPSESYDEARTVSLLVQPDQAEKLMMATALGAIKLSLRAPDDTGVDETEGCTVSRVLGRGDVADEVDGSGHVGLFPSMGSAADASAGSDPAHWRMQIASPFDVESFRWSAPGQLPEREKPASDTDPASPHNDNQREDEAEEAEFEEDEELAVLDI
jgi:Flp pilus assembly protein CpaB